MPATPTPRTAFAAYIDSITEATGLTPTELARKAGVTPSTLTRPRSDARHRSGPSLGTLRKLARIAPEVPVPSEFSPGSKPASIDANSASGASGIRMPSSSAADGGRVEILAPAPLRVGADGRIEVPATFVSILEARPGEALVTRVVDGVMTIETIDHALRRVRAAVRRHVPDGVSLVDELIAERRAAAARE